jgi:branched-chain amino acid aminotransferase
MNDGAIDRPSLPMMHEILPDFLGLEDADYSKAIAYVDGAWSPLDQARIPMRDFGFLRSDLTYDVLHVWNGSFFRLDDHLDRFAASCQGFRLDPGRSRAELAALLAEAVSRTGLRYAIVWFACSRGVPPLGSRDPQAARNTFYIYAAPLVLRGSPQAMQRGLAARIHPTIRRIPPDSIDPRLKNTHWADFTSAEYSVRDEGYDLPILLDRDGFVTEGIGCNIFAVVDGTLVTPAQGCLQGIAALTMMELAKELGIPASYGQLPADALRDADEAFMTSTSCGLFPITRVDERILSNGTPGPVATRLLAAYYLRKDTGWHMTPIAYA